MMNGTTATVREPGPAPGSETLLLGAARGAPPVDSTPRFRTLLAIPVASCIALGVHLFISKKQPFSETQVYSVFLSSVLVLALTAAAAQPFWPHLRRWMAHMCPIIAAAVFSLCLWELITTGFRLLPLPYFPSPAAVVQSLVDDRDRLFDST